jgi:RNA polymerase sigma-70 factor (ECF subfamily)
MNERQSALCGSADAPVADAQFSAEIVDIIPALERFSRRLYRDHEAAADLVQETLARAWEARTTFAPGTNLKAWLFAIMRNRFHSELRRSWRQVPWDAEAAERIAAPHAEQLWTIELGDTVRAMDTLSVGQRDALILSAVAGLSSKNIAAILQCRPTAAKSRVHRARHAVAAMLEGRERIDRKRGGNGGYPIAELVGQLHRLTGSPGRGAPPRAASAA